MSEYSIYVLPDEFQAIKKLPGNVRQRVKLAIDDLAGNPRPPASKQLKIDEPDDVDVEEKNGNYEPSIFRRQSLHVHFGNAPGRR